MSAYFIHYAESNAVCLIIFAILLIHDLLSMDRQEKQIKYDNALVSFMLYFISDSLWAAVDSGVLPQTQFSVLATNFSNYVITVAVTYTWLNYVMAVEQIPNRDKPRNKLAVLFPLLISTFLLIVIYFIAPGALINNALEIQFLYSVFFVAVPYVYIGAVIFYAFRKAKAVENPAEKRVHLYVGFFPLMVVLGGFIEMVFLPTMPIYCFCCTILMLMFYIQSMDRQISKDPLTDLNNRGELFRYVSQNSNLRKESRKTFVCMLDINDFKAINDTYGHAEGDRALVLLANALQQVTRQCSYPLFLGRYGGDEFILILHPTSEEDVKELAALIRRQIHVNCVAEGTPYQIGIGIGYEELRAEDDTFQLCQQRADRKLYLDKRAVKFANRIA